MASGGGGAHSLLAPQVLEQEPEAARGGDWVSQSQVKEVPPTAAGAPATFPSYEQRQQQAGSQYESLSDGVVAHMRRVYATLATGIGISAAASVTWLDASESKPPC